MATGENLKEPQKDKVADPEEHIKDKGNAIKDVKDAGEAAKFIKTNEPVIIEEVVVEENKKKNEAETKEIMVENKGKEANQTEKKKDEVEKADASKCTKVEKSSSMATEEKLEEGQKNRDVVEEVVKEENKKTEAEPREIVVEKKGKEAGQTEKKKDEVEKGDASKCTKVEKSSSMATKEKLEEAQKDRGVVEEVVKEENKKTEAEATEIVVEKKGKEAEQTEKKKDEVEKGDASKCTKVEKSSSMATKEKLEEAQKDKGVVEEVVKEEKKKTEAEATKIVVEKKGKEADQTEKKKDEVEKSDASKCTKVEKSSSMGTEQKLEEAQKEKGVVEELVKEEKKKKIEEEPREIVVDDKMKAETGKEVGLEEQKDNAEVGNGGASESGRVEKCSSLREERNSLSELKEHEKKSLAELRSKIEIAIHENKLLKENKDQVGEENVSKENEKEKEPSKKVEEIEEKEERKIETKDKGEQIAVNGINKEKETSNEVEEVEAAKPNKQEDEQKEKTAEQKKKKVEFNINKDIAIWGVPLLPSKEDNATDVILLKFLRAKEFEVNDAFEMLRNTLKWRKDNNIDSILDENFGDDLSSISSMGGVGREGHPVCYSNFKLLGNEELYNKVLGTEEKRNMFIRSRVQLIERAIQKLDFKPGGVSSIFMINDLNQMPGPSKKELRNAIKQVFALHQDNYPELVARNIFLNVPFWYYAFSASALLSPFFTPRTNSKFVFARPSRVNDVLLKYIALEELPVDYGGLRKENDPDFSSEDVVSEIFINQSSSESIHIPAPEAGMTLMWEVLVSGWEVNYKEEFIPTEEGSYGIIVQRSRRIGAQDGSIRNSFTTKEPGMIVLTIENGALIKKKRICYRYKIKNRSSS
ncbi:hypothetical protein ABKV19_005638 [Rosa sericea]